MSRPGRLRLPARPRELRRWVYSATLLVGTINLVTVYLLERRTGIDDPVVNYIFPASAVLCLAMLVWLQLGRSLAVAERIMFGVVAAQLLAQLTLTRPELLGAQLNTTYWLTVGLCLLAYLMFNARFATLFSLGAFSLSVAVPWLGGLGIGGPGAPTTAEVLRQQMSAATVLVLVYSLALYRTRYFAEQRERLLLARLAGTDQLTGLANRHSLYPAIERLLAEARPAQPGALLLLDLDDFKGVNDHHGHNVGDTVLIQAARLYQEALPPGGVVGRWGGEEFLILLPHHDAARAQRWADGLRAAMTRAEWAHGGPLTASGGLSAVHPGDDLTSLVARADAALYRAKAAGRDRVLDADAAPHDEVRQPAAAG